MLSCLWLYQSACWRECVPRAVGLMDCILGADGGKYPDLRRADDGGSSGMPLPRYLGIIEELSSSPVALVAGRQNQVTTVADGGYGRYGYPLGFDRFILLSL